MSAVFKGGCSHPSDAGMKAPPQKVCVCVCVCVCVRVCVRVCVCVLPLPPFPPPTALEECKDKQAGHGLWRLMPPMAPLILPLWCYVSTLTMTLGCLLTWPPVVRFSVPRALSVSTGSLIGPTVGASPVEQMSAGGDLSVAHHLK